MKKICKYCKKEKEESDYYKSTRHTSGYELKCKACYSDYNKKRYINNPEKYKQAVTKYYTNYPDAKRRIMLKHSYNITIEEYDILLEKQDNKCAICQIHKDKINRSLDVDHCHKTNKIRGLLCPICNKALGLFNDNIENLNKAINYLNLNTL